jgi:hypothetical protein
MALMEAVENQKQVYHRSHRPWKSLQDFRTTAADHLLVNKTKMKTGRCVTNYQPSSVSQPRGPLQVVPHLPVTLYHERR